MKKMNSYIAFVLLLTVMFASVPKVYIHSLLGHNHSQSHHSKYISVSANHETQNCDFQKFEGVVDNYLLNGTAFDFTKPDSYTTLEFSNYQLTFFEKGYSVYLVRGPPLASFYS